jgi:hypothetical protein
MIRGTDLAPMAHGRLKAATGVTDTAPATV